jgi:glycosyltransferase involved in cell wall biosynthesis
MDRLRVLMIGTSTQTRGGVATVERLMLEAGGARYTHLVTHSDHPLGKHVQFLLALVRCLLLPRGAYDLAHVHFAVRGSLYRKYLLTRALRWKAIPYVLHSHAPVSVLEGESRAWQARALRMLGDARGLIALSKTWQQFYGGVTRGRLPIWTLPNPVRLPPPPDRPQPARPLRLLFLGRIGERKGAFRLLAAMARLSAIAPGRVHLTMAGDGDVAAARDYCEQAGLADCAEIRSWAEEEEKCALLARSDVFVLPSLAEGQPMALIEAMAYELAVIACPVGGIPDLVTDGENGLLVPVADERALLDALLRLLSEPELRRRLAANARASVAGLSLPRYADSLATIYGQALSFSPFLPGAAGAMH